MLNDKRLLKVDAEKIRNLLTSQQSDLISDGAASSKKDLLKPKIQPDIISGGVASLIQKLQQKLDDVKYYQSAMVSGINPNQKIDVVDLTKNFVSDSKLTKKDLSNYIQTLIGTKPLNTKDKNALASFVKTSKRVGKRDVYSPDHIANSSKVEVKF